MSIILKAADGEQFELDNKLAIKSNFIKHILSDIPSDGEPKMISLPNIESSIIEKIILFLKHHAQIGDDVKNEEEERKFKFNTELDRWDEEFCRVDQKTLFDLIQAANFLDIKLLLDVTCKVVANMIRGKTAEEIRKTFNIANDFTEEEEQKIKEEHAWCLG